MKRLLIIAIAALAVAVMLGVARRVVGAKVVGLMDRMMENVMPRMMDTCFAEMSPERREFMLAHCRGALDRVDAKYVRGEAAEPATERVEVA
jgi:hypothetical protein